jgi:hypothetical protein
MGPADEHEHGTGLDELEQLARQQSAVLGRRRREHEDDARVLQQPTQARRLDALVSQVGVGQPGVVRAELAAERLDERTQAPPDVPEADEADALAGEEKRVERVCAAQPALLSRPHQPILGDEVPTGRECERQRHLGDSLGEGRRGREHPDATFEAACVVELGRPAAGNRED